MLSIQSFLFQKVKSYFIDQIENLDFPLSKSRIKEVRPVIARQVFTYTLQQMENVLDIPIVYCYNEDVTFRKEIYYMLRQLFKANNGNLKLLDWYDFKLCIYSLYGLYCPD